MDKYIKLDDLIKFIENKENEIKNDYENKRIEFSSLCMGTGVLINLKKQILKEMIE